MKSRKRKQARFARRGQGSNGPVMQKRELRLLEGAALAIITILVIGLFCISAIQLLVIRSGQGAAVVSAVLVDLANGDRASQSLGGLTLNPVLAAAAQAKADDMAAKSYFAHLSPEGYDFWYWIDKAGYKYSMAGENLAIRFATSEAVVQGWMNSPTHKENILRAGFSQIGTGMAEGMYEGHPTIFIVQHYGNPKPEAIKVSQITSPP